MNGQIRVAIEVIKELDKIVEKDLFEIVAPESDYTINDLKNIRIIRFGKGNIHVWEQTYLMYYLFKNKRTVINILNSHPIFKPDICYVHDVIFKAYPSIYAGGYGFFQKFYTLLMIYTSIKLGKRILTVSEFSKQEILKYYKVDSEKIDVIYNGWEHISRIDEDDTAIEKNGLKNKEYYLSVSGLTPQKNFKWVMQNAAYNKSDLYVIVGKKEGATSLTDLGDTENVLFLGEKSDQEVKCLMKNCKGFIHPAIYEGFGLTPLEAIASGAKCIYLSKIPCLEEIYGEAAAFFDPHSPDIDLESIKKEMNDSEKNVLLTKYSWHSAARKLKSILETI